MSETATRLQNVFRNVFEDDEIVIEEGTTSKDIEDWDSLMHIELITAIESEFGIRFTTDEMSSAANVGEFISLIDEKNGA